MRGLFFQGPSQMQATDILVRRGSNLIPYCYVIIVIYLLGLFLTYTDNHAQKYSPSSQAGPLLWLLNWNMQ